MSSLLICYFAAQQQKHVYLSCASEMRNQRKSKIHSVVCVVFLFLEGSKVIPSRQYFW